MTWADLFARPMPAPDRTVETGESATDVVDVWLPDGEGPHPTVIVVHGGCWQKSIADRTIMNYAADALRKEGMAVWNIEYRGVDEEGGGYPGTYQDVGQAVDALRAFGPELGLRTDGVAAFGHSAGGHLALWAASRHKIPADSPLYSPDPLPIAGVVNSGGLADLEASVPHTQPECLANVLTSLTGAPSETRANVFSDTSPAELLPAGVWAYSVNGADDPIAPPLLGEGYAQKAASAGDDADVAIIPETGHVELITPGTAAFKAETAILKDMLGVWED
ncbi:alpha/beta hydrolase [Henriciella sp. AS95]|uniref:alpha/beta hydrolase n=1 Tax=Henriciella sp. AS95 TaxID=3135782 RepID=UPI00317D3FE7